MRRFRVSFLVDEPSVGAVTGAICTTAEVYNLVVAEYVAPAPPAPPPPKPAAQLELKVRRPARPLNEDNSITFKAAIAALDLIVAGCEITRADLTTMFLHRGLKASSVSPCMTHMTRRGYVTRVRLSVWRKVP